VQLGKTITLDLGSPEEIWNNLTSKNRNVIRKAQKSGIRIYHGQFPEIYDIFRTLYDSTMDRDHADEYYYFTKDFYSSVLIDLPLNAQIFYADLNGKVVAAAIMLLANKKINYHLSGMLRDYSSMAPSNLLLYTVALWGNANGYQTLFLGGGVGSQEDNLFKFKKAFYRGDYLNSYFIGKKIYSIDSYDKLVNLRSDYIRNDFFPEYRG
jgi:lipid II:glycine glycyltransferase (peptidoglycan interpeptide bridge formation enzyme)